MSDFEVPTQIFMDQDDTLGYEWNVFHVYVRTFGDPNWRFYFDSDSGCSCYSYDTPDWPNVNCWNTRSEVIIGYINWATCLSPMQKMQGLETLITALNAN